MKKILVLLFILVFGASSAIAHEAIGKWNKRELNVYIEENRNAYLMKKAFGDWETSTKKEITFEYVEDPNEADIKVYFVDKVSNQIDKAVGIAHSWRNANGHFTEVKIEIAKYPEEGKMKLSNLDLSKTMRHEIGHALGLGHTDIPYSIMNPTIDKCLNIGKEDIKIFNQIYGIK